METAGVIAMAICIEEGGVSRLLHFLVSVSVSVSVSAASCLPLWAFAFDEHIWKCM